MKKWLALIGLLFALSVEAQTLSLTQAGSGVTATTTVTSTLNGKEQFRLVWEAADNWGLSQWYDSLNDPSLTTNLILAYSVNGPSSPCNRESAIDNFVLYADSDDKLAIYETNTGCAFAANFPAASISVLYNTPWEIALTVTANPLSATTAPDTNLTGTITYYIFPDGKIHLHNVLHATNAVNLSTDNLYAPTMELNNPTGGGGTPPDTAGWIRADNTENPWTEGDYPFQNLPYIFAYWSPNTPSPNTTFTKASIMLNRSASNPATPPRSLIIHGWSCGTGCGVTRWGYAGAGPNLSAGQTITDNYMIQLGTQGSSVLPNLVGSGSGGSGTCATCNTISTAYLATPVISPVTPSVNQGSTQQFTELQGDAGTWSCSATNASGGATTCAGSINSSTGVYTAPATVTAKQSLGGYQLLPNNHIYNTRIDSLPVNSNSAAWIGVSSVPISFFQISFPVNYTNASTPVQNMSFFYPNQPGSPNNGPFQIPVYPGTYPAVAKIENGWISATTNKNADHHLLTFDTTTGNMQDMYQYYNLGASSSCPTCNSQQGIKYSATGYALAAPGGTSDAAGMFITPAMLRLQEMENAVATSGSINHAIRMTLSLGFCASSNLWPATAFATDGGTVPFGARFRLKSTFTKSTYSSICQTAACQNAVQILITQMKQYGVILADGGTNWATQVEYTKWPTQLADALYEISYSNITPSNFEAVDESSLMVSASSGLTTANREIITFTRTSDGHTASTDVVLTGVAVNFPYDLQQIQVGAPAQTFTALANIGTVTYSMSPTGTGTLNSTSGLYTPPSSVSSPTTITVIATSNVNSSVTASFTLNVFPAGPIRLVPGSVPASSNYVMTPTNYTDTSSNVWYPLGDDGGYSNGAGTGISGTTDSKLYGYEYGGYQGQNDERFDFIVPNGSYQITFKGASTFGGAGTQVQNLELNGTTVYSNLDLFTAAGGSNKAFDWTSAAVSVTDNHLSFVERAVGINGTHIGALQIASNTYPTSGCSGSGVLWYCQAGALVSDVQGALNLATDGAVIHFNQGSYTWASQIQWKAATGSTMICDFPPLCTITASNTIWGVSTYTGINDHFYRISGFTVTQSGANPTLNVTGATGGGGGFTAFRMDHITFNEPSNNSSVQIQLGANGPVNTFAGVVDHNTFSSAASADQVLYVVGGLNNAPPPNLQGTPNNIFFEDNTLSNAAPTAQAQPCTDGWGTEAIVIRHNTSLNCVYTNHNMLYGGGPINMEVYNNLIQVNGNASGILDCYRCIHFQGSGTTIFFNNEFTPFSGQNSAAISVLDYRDYTNGIDFGIVPWPAASQCGGILNFPPLLDGNRAPTGTNFGYPCWHAPNRDFQGNLAPTYTWGNLWCTANTYPCTPTTTPVLLSMEHLGGFNPDYYHAHNVANRDYYNDTTPTAFNGTVGTGFGPLSSRPSTCTTGAEPGGGVGYAAQTTKGTIGASSGAGVASDAVLYRCTATNTWTKSYAPYIYPHPYVTSASGGPAGAVAARPTANQTPGAYKGANVPLTVIVTDSSTSPTLYCTVDGTTPTHPATGTTATYVGSSHTFTIGTSGVPSIVVINCLASSGSLVDSLIGSFGYLLNQTAYVPTFKPLPGVFDATQTVGVWNSAYNVRMCITTDGTTPTGDGNGNCVNKTDQSNIGDSFRNETIAATTTLKAIATGVGYNDSPVFPGVYTIGAGTGGAFFTPPSPVAFGSQPSGTASTPQPVVVNNPSTANALVITAVNMPSGFLNVTPTSVGNTCGAVPITVPKQSGLIPGTCVLQIEFSPSSATTYSADMTITDGANSSPQHLTLTGTGTSGSTAAAPVFTPAPGSYSAAVTLTMATGSPGAVICYTNDGVTVPATNGVTGCTTGTLYTGAISVPTTTTFEAIAGGTGYADSSVTTGTYTITVQAAEPSFSPVAGTYPAPQSVLITTTSGSVICYTVDGVTTPITNGTTGCTAGTLYSGAVPIATTTTLMAIAGGTGFSDSPLRSGVYNIAIPQAADPTFSPVSGSYQNGITVTISDTTAGAVICYTLDGTAPSTNAAGSCTTTNPATQTYSTPLAVPSTVTIRAVATVASGFTDSHIARAPYVIGQVAAPKISVILN